MSLDDKTPCYDQSDPFYNAGALFIRHGGSIVNGEWQRPVSNTTLVPGARFINGRYEAPADPFAPPPPLMPPSNPWR